MIAEYLDVDGASAHDQFQAWRESNQEGIFLTLVTRTRASLHGARCQHLGSGPPYYLLEDGFGSLTNKRKVCGSRAELSSWAQKNGVGVQRCLHCERDGLIGDGAASFKTSSVLSPGMVYTRNDLAERFGITDATLNTGIFQPNGHESVWLFVTERKTPDRTQYADLLAGDELTWDGQTAGRKDLLIIEHEAHGLELLLFYRKIKNEFGNYGFRYEGPFRYVSHKGTNPAHFQLVRLGVTPVPFALVPVHTPAEILASLTAFNSGAAQNRERTGSILNTTTYWVFDAASGLFGPGKYVGFAGMTFEGYEAGNRGNTTGAKFDGNVTKRAIESAADSEFIDSPPLGDRLLDWATLLLGPEPFGNANPGKWQFLMLDEPPSELATEEVVGALEGRLARGQGFVMNPALRKAIELHAMAAATQHFVSEGYTVEDVSQCRPYDLRCERNGEVLYVEVKGTQSSGEEVILTAGEVEFARRHRAEMALFVLHSVEVTATDNGHTLSPGDRRVCWPWDVDQGVLQSLSYYYSVPPGAPAPQRERRGS